MAVKLQCFNDPLIFALAPLCLKNILDKCWSFDGQEAPNGEQSIVC